MEAPAAAAPAPAAGDLIREGDYVVVDEHGDKKSLVVIKANGRAKVGKSYIDTGDLIGARWGSTYTLSAGSHHLTAITEHEPVSAPAVEEVEKDNRDLVDLNTSQALTTKDIEAMKASGKGGDEIIDALCKHSTTFEAKTEFAQDKYKRRKARKYLTRLTLRQPTGWTVCQVLFDKSPQSVWNMRPDSLALVLSLANVGAGARCLVLENCQGLVSGAVAERLGGVGALCCLGTGSKPPPLTVLYQMNLAPGAKAAVSTTQLADLLAAAQRRSSAQAAAITDPEQQLEGQPPAKQQHQGDSQQEEQPAAKKQRQVNSQQPAANGSETQQAAAAGGSCAVEAAAAEQAGAGLVSRSIPVVAAAAVSAAVEAQPARAVAAGGDNMEEDTLDAMYDSTAAAAAGDAAGNAAPGGDNKKRRRGTAAAGAGAQPQAEGGAGAPGQQQTRHKKQQQQQQGEAGSPVDTEMVEGDTAAAGAAAAGQGVKGGPNKEGGRVQHLHTPEAVDQVLAAGFNSCIIAAPKLQPGAVLQQVLPLLAPSSPFVVYSPWVQPLAEAMAALTASRGAVMMQLQESWLRPYQVLPGRTHPHMALTTGGTGGYILSGITVVPSAGGDEGGAQQQRQTDHKRGGGRGGGRGRGGRGRGGSMRR